ncbi:MAG: Asp-tRNA(Asn)/Glu-tRNA(Gln) amidotransferase subunit GatA [Candidatus Saccharimonadales bacterium]
MSRLMDNNAWQPLSELVASVKNGRTSAESLVKRSLEQIEKLRAEYNATILTLSEAALKQAKKIDQDIKDGKDPGVLSGVPYIAKDNFLVLGSETRAASNILSGFIAPYQSSAISALEQAGAICVAKSNMDAFAHGASTENSDFGVTKNPYDKTRVSGGSSGGSAAAVALGLAPFALGTDTGGSIRQPSAFCGVVGLKPTYGLVSRSGVIAMGSSLDCIGPITSRVEDAALVLDVLARRDELDATTIERDTQGYAEVEATPLKNAKIGVIKEYLEQGVDSEVKARLESLINKLESKGAKITYLSLPLTKLALACYYIITPAEVSSNLSRYDGIRYGYSDQGAKDLDSSYLNTRGKGFGKEAKRRIIIGTFVLSSGYYDAYYKKAMTVRTKLIDQFDAALKEVDYLIGPVAPTTAFKIGEKTKDPLQMYLADVMTVAANLTGIPAISIPNGFDSNGLPIGTQLMAAQKRDRDLLSMAKTVEEVSSHA